MRLTYNSHWLHNAILRVLILSNSYFGQDRAEIMIADLFLKKNTK